MHYISLFSSDVWVVHCNEIKIYENFEDYLPVSTLISVPGGNENLKTC